MNQADRDFIKEAVLCKLLEEQELERPQREADIKARKDFKKLSNLKNLRLLSIVALVAYVMLWVHSAPLAMLFTFCWPLKGYTMKRRYRRRF